ncbi:hypothetical protein D3C84_866710 [compost metagenome]
MFIYDPVKEFFGRRLLLRCRLLLVYNNTFAYSSRNLGVAVIIGIIADGHREEAILLVGSIKAADLRPCPVAHKPDAYLTLAQYFRSLLISWRKRRGLIHVVLHHHIEGVHQPVKYLVGGQIHSSCSKGADKAGNLRAVLTLPSVSKRKIMSAKRPVHRRNSEGFLSAGFYFFEQLL